MRHTLVRAAVVAAVILLASAHLRVMVHAAGRPAPMRDSEAALEERGLFGAPGATEWSAAESNLEDVTDRARATPPALRWRVTVDHTSGEPAYPIGWPRINRAFPEGPARDWSAWDSLHMRVRVDTSRAKLPPEPAVLILYTPDKAAAYHRPLLELKKGEWVTIDIPLAQVPRPHDVRLLQFSLSESEYRHGDRLEVTIAGLSLRRHTRPVLLELATESAALFDDVTRLPVRFRMAGVPPGERAEITCELRRGGTTAARASTRTPRGAGRLVLDLGGRRLEPGAYELTARVGGGRSPATARVRVVASPWK